MNLFSNPKPGESSGKSFHIWLILLEVIAKVAVQGKNFLRLHSLEAGQVS